MRVGPARRRTDGADTAYPLPAPMDLRVLFVAGHDERLDLDCVLSSRYGPVPSGTVFAMTVALPHGIEPNIESLFARWSTSDTDVHVRLCEGTRASTVRAIFVADDTRADLDLVASSPLRGTEGAACRVAVPRRILRPVTTRIGGRTVTLGRPSERR